VANYDDDIYDDLNDTDMEAPGGTQATHPAIRWMRDRDFDVRDIADLPANLSDEIREHPLRSIALAVGAGYLLSKIV